ncbi:MAG: hypothetical protein LBD91_03305 [Prevotellaceae bacterium]|jgi:hypothetical protein|nr:hypothetical protein [Prevotellaceae bacterium]
MKNSDYIPRRDADLLAWVIAFLAALSTILTRVGFPQTVYAELSALLNTFKDALAIAVAPATRTKAAVKAKNDARKALVQALRLAIMQYLTYNQYLTDADRENLGLPIHKTTRTEAPVATEAPDMDIDTSVISRITIHFFEKGSGHKKGKPDGQHGAEIVWLLSDTPVVRWDELSHSDVDTNSPYTLVFEHDQRGKTIYFALRWVNTSSKKGPWSDIMSAIIP